MKETFWLFLIAMAAACGSAGLANRATVASFANASGPRWQEAGFSEGEVKEASRLYIVKCTKCHELYKPSDYNDKDWQYWLTLMSKKAHLNPEQAQLLSRFTVIGRHPAN